MWNVDEVEITPTQQCFLYYSMNSITWYYVDKMDLNRDNHGQ